MNFCEFCNLLEKKGVSVSFKNKWKTKAKLDIPVNSAAEITRLATEAGFFFNEKTNLLAKYEKEKVWPDSFNPENLKSKWISFFNGDQIGTLKVAAIDGFVQVDTWYDDVGIEGDDDDDLGVIYENKIYSPIVNGQLLTFFKESGTNLESYY